MQSIADLELHGRAHSAAQDGDFAARRADTDQTGAREKSAIAQDEAVSSILVIRLGSIGDFVVALPCLHHLRARYPRARITLLTNWPVDSRAAPAAAILDGSGLVDGYLRYTAGTRNPRELARVFRDVRSVHADLLVYLVDRPSALPVWRDYLFFRLGGIRQLVGFPFAADLRLPRSLRSNGGGREPEAQRLARCLAPIGAVDCERAESWDLVLSDVEKDMAARFLGTLTPVAGPGLRLIGLSVGTKQPQKDWGDTNWRAVLARLRRPDVGLVLIGSREDRERSEGIARDWSGPVLNACGSLAPRVSAAVLRHLDLLMCHDSGPMHLAAAVGTTCVAVFAANDLPGRWDPFGGGHMVLRPTAAPGGIQTISPAQVVAAVAHVLERSRR